MTIYRLIEQISAQAGMSSDQENPGMILLLMQQVLERYTAKVKFSECKVGDSLLTPASAGISYVTLPSDLQHIDLFSVRFRQDNDVDLDRYLQFGNTARAASSGITNRYDLQGTKLTLAPYDEIATADRIVLDYWQRLTITTTDDINTSFPIQKLENIVQLETTAKLLRSTDSKSADRYQAEATADWTSVLATIPRI